MVDKEDDFYVNEDVVIFYEKSGNQNIIDFFESHSNFEGFGTVSEVGDTYIKVLDCDWKIDKKIVLSQNDFAEDIVEWCDTH